MQILFLELDEMGLEATATEVMASRVLVRDGKIINSKKFIEFSASLALNFLQAWHLFKCICAF